MRAGERAYHALREDIVEWRLPPGQVLGEVELSDRLGISRTPVREALSRLTADGLAEPHGGRGVVVAAISAADVRSLYEFRDSLDCRAAELAARRGDPQVFRALADDLEHAADALVHHDSDHVAYFHLVARMDAAIEEAAANPFLRQAQAGVRLHLARVRKLSKSNPQRLASAAREHQRIAVAIADRDATLAIAATRVHLDNALQHALRTKELAPVQHAAP